MFSINQKGPIYDPTSVQPMRDELSGAGFTELITPADVDMFIGKNNDKTVLVFLNSVCGCATGSARPGITLALQNKIIPDVLLTVFAGQDRDAVDQLRSQFLPGVPPSSPFIALYKNGELVHTLQRFNIEGRTADDIAEELALVFNKTCSRQGPSVSPEAYENLPQFKRCGSKIPLANQN